MDKLSRNPANSSPLTPLTFLERAAIVYGDCTSVIDNSTTFTWSQTHRRCLRVASSLSSLGIGKGHVVSVLSPNTPAMYELQFAVPMSGATLSNLNFRLDHHTLSTLLRHSESKLLFVDTLLLTLALRALSTFPPKTPKPKLVLITDDALAPHQTKTESQQTQPPLDTYESLVARGDPEFEWIQPDSEWDPIVLNYTSGTTSSPKGVVHSHRSMFVTSLDSLIHWPVPTNPVYLWILAIFHCNGWTYPWGMAAVGGTNVCTRKIDAPTIYRLIELHGVTHTCAAPVVLNMLSSYKEARPLKKPVRMLTGGSPPPAAVLFRAEEMGFDVTHVFGMTEAGGVVLTCAWRMEWDRFPPTERARLKARQGVRTLGITEVDVVDTNTGKRVRRDGVSVGEVVIRGAGVMLGYLKDVEATRKCVKRDGWLYTGDMGVMHEDGYIEIKDRSKDVIISGGENLSSVEVESVLYMHPAVNEAAVVARPDEFWGETPCAFVSLKEKVTEKEVMEFCRERLPHFMVPKTVVFREELPKNATGKIEKHVLRSDAQAMGSLSAPAPPLPSRM